MSLDLPAGLSGAYRALSYGHDAHRALRWLTSLVWLRIATDPTMPNIGGCDSRKLFELPEWDAGGPLEPDHLKMLDGLSTVINAELSEPDLLATDWHELSPESVAKAFNEVGRWQPDAAFADDPLGEIAQRVRGDKSALGEYYTPYNVSLMMAMMTAPEPGWNVLDPACGSGRMLLASLEACRKEHGPDKIPEVYGIDISPEAVRLCRLNLALAGVAPAFRVECADFLRMTPPEELSPIQRSMQIQLFEYEAGEVVGWRQRGAA